VTFFYDYTYWVNEDDTLWGTWFTVGDYVDFTFDEYPSSHYIGTLDYTGEYMDGTMDNLDNMTGCWYAIKTSTSTTVPAIEGDWDIYYDWSCTGTYSGPAAFTFFYDFSFSVTEEGSDPSYGTWFTVGDYVDFTFNDDPFSHYIGTLDSSSTYMEGTMDNTAGGTGCWYAIR
jgi:hypothetical protein